MKNQRVILVNGIQRGGTNIVWNLLQSHPEIVSPVFETGQLIYPAWVRHGKLGVFARSVARSVIRAGFRPCLRRIDRVLYQYKLSTLHHEDNKYKTEDEPYTIKELESAILVTKSVGDDIALTPILSSYFPHGSCISVVRNGLAVCEGWVRRGFSVENVAAAYCRSVDEVLKQDRELARHMIIKFEDCLSDTRDQLYRMYQFVEVDPTKVEKIRIKSKSVIVANGDYTASFGVAGSKTWIKLDDAADYLDPGVTQRQIQRLSTQARDRFLELAGDSMRRLGYIA